MKQVKKIIKRIINNDLLSYLIAILICILFSLAGILINLNRFYQYELGYYDFGIFDRAIWNLSRFQMPIIDHFLVGGKIIFADHFNPSIFLFTPVYWLTSKSEALLIAINITVGLSGLILFIIGNKLLRNSWQSLAFVIVYFLFTGLQNAVYSEFHEVTAMTLFLMLAYWALFSNKMVLYYIFLLITLGFKESLFFLGIGLAIFLFLYDKNRRYHAYATFIISVLWGYFSIGIVKKLAGGVYYYMPYLSGNLFELFYNLFFPLIKIRTLLLSFLSFAFLPVVSYQFWPLFFLHYSHRFLSTASTKWDLGLHYNAEIAPTLAIASILGIILLKKYFSKKIINIIIVIMIFLSFMLYRFILHGPIALAYNPAFYRHTKNFYFLDKMIRSVPKNKSVAAQNNLTVPFLHQKDIWILTDNYRLHQPEFILLDVRPGQNPSNYLGIKNPELLLKKIKVDKNYKIHYQRGDQYVFKKNSQ